MAGTFADWAKDGYVVCAPKSTGQVWETADLKCVVRLITHLRKALPVDAEKTHVVGFSNGGWNLAPVAFDDAVRARSASWIAAGYRGASVPKWAKETLGAIALAGSEDGNNRAARQTVPGWVYRTGASCRART
jgi:poly(3-hydroxybutyrate) depolymerase